MKMQTEDLKKLAELLAQELNKTDYNIENSFEFKQLMKDKETKTIRILKSINEMLVTHCDNGILSPSQFASKAIAEKLIRDTKFQEEKELLF